MKFTQSETINQRIDQITMKHAVVGIDIAKDVHAAQITDEFIGQHIRTFLEL